MQTFGHNVDMKWCKLRLRLVAVSPHNKICKRDIRYPYQSTVYNRTWLYFNNDFRMCFSSVNMSKLQQLLVVVLCDTVLSLQWHYLLLLFISFRQDTYTQCFISFLLNSNPINWTRAFIELIRVLRFTMFLLISYFRVWLLGIISNSVRGQWDVFDLYIGLKSAPFFLDLLTGGFGN